MQSPFFFFFYCTPENMNGQILILNCINHKIFSTNYFFIRQCTLGPVHKLEFQIHNNTIYLYRTSRNKNVSQEKDKMKRK